MCAMKSYDVHMAQPQPHRRGRSTVEASTPSLPHVTEMLTAGAAGSAVVVLAAAVWFPVAVWFAEGTVVFAGGAVVALTALAVTVVERAAVVELAGAAGAIEFAVEFAGAGGAGAVYWLGCEGCRRQRVSHQMGRAHACPQGASHTYDSDHPQYARRRGLVAATIA